MRWLKLHNEARTDKKLAILTLAERGVWVNLLCYANEQEERGTFDASDRYVLALECAEGDEDVLNSTLDKLLRVRHVVPLDDDGRMTFRTFASRQYDKPSDEPERVADRVRRHREKRRAERTKGDTNTVKRPVTRSNALDSDSDRESDTERESGHTANVVPLKATNGEASASRSPHPNAPYWEALKDALDLEEYPTTKAEKSKWGVVVRDLKAAGATPEEIRVRVRRMIDRWGRQYVTVTSIPGRWTECANERKSVPLRPTGTGDARAYQPTVNIDAIPNL